MKRDMNLVRDLLLKLEAWPQRGQSIAMIEPHDERLAVPETTVDEIAYHLRLIREQGFLDSPGSQPLSGGITFRGLTWEGHDFLDTVRDDRVWKKTMADAQAVGGWTLDILSGLAKAIIKAKLKASTGLDI
jgi:Hypothetical protein (DUF2513)